MPPRKKAAAGTATKTRRSTRRQKVEPDDIPDVYYEMVAEAQASSINDAPRPVKRRKLTPNPDVGQGHVLEPTSDPIKDSPSLNTTASNPQVIYDDFEDSNDDDIEFEDVDIDVPEADASEPKTLTINLSGPATTPSRKLQRRRVVDGEEKRLRLEFHKLHVQLLLLALWNRNRWCESQQVQALLKPLVSRKTISQLHVDEAESQFQRSHSFNLAIQEICTLWRTTFDITEPGMRRAHWRDGADFAAELAASDDYLDFDDFKTAAQTHRGSRDVGAQLLCALLRSLAIEARLVCSLQVLPFSAVAKGTTPEKPRSEYIFAEEQSYQTSNETTKRKKIVDSAYPIWWVEVHSPAASTWMPLDPLVRNTIKKPKTGFEPPASDVLNSMSYVIAFEDDGSARDVTRRYTQWFNAKTRKARVESTRGGEQWWNQAMKLFEKQFPELRDTIEDDDLLRRARAEGLPKNVQDFRGHPVYVLERHLRMNEVIEPKREVGKVAVGSGSKAQKMETVFRRQDVHLCRTADAWYRRGRDVRKGEVPLKRVVSRRQRARSMEQDEDADETAAVYAEYQTDVYEPPPVDNGKVPKNHFGNLDVYVSSMIPGGAVHVRHPLAAKAAQVLGIDYAEAVTGFEFKGRQGTAVINGAVVAAETRVAMVAVLVGLQSQASEEVRAERSHILVGLWKRWLTSLRIRERIERDYGDMDDETESAREHSVGDDEEDGTYQDNEAGGGFVPGEAHDAAEEREVTRAQLPSATAKQVAALLPPEPVYAEIVVIESPHEPPRPAGPHDGPLAAPEEESEQEAGGFVVDEEQEPGGFLADDEDYEGGGFMLEEDHTATSPPQPNHRPPPASNNDIAGGFLPNEPAPVQEVREKSEEAQTQRAPPLTALLSKPPPSISNDSGGGFLPTSPQRAMQTTKANTGCSRNEQVHTTEQETNNTAAAPEQHESVDSDVSMLSHDPDEDEAEPEWLVDSLL